MTLTLKLAYRPFGVTLSVSWWCTTIQSLVTKGSYPLWPWLYDRNPIFSQDAPADDDVPSYKFGCIMVSSSGDTVESYILIKYKLSLDLAVSTTISYMTLHLLIMNHHTKFGYKRFSSWEDIVKMKHSLEFPTFPWPWPQKSNPIFSQDNPACDDVSLKFGCRFSVL